MSRKQRIAFWTLVQKVKVPPVVVLTIQLAGLVVSIYLAVKR